MQQRREAKSIIGDCEACDAVRTEVWMMHGNMLVCKSCREKELALLQNAPTVQTPAQAAHTIREFGKVEQTISLQADVYNAATIPFVELRAAIYANPEIPADKKQVTFVSQMNDHMVHLKRVLFETQASIRACQTIGQSAAMELHETERAKYAEFDVTGRYGVKPIKPASVKKAATGKAKVPTPKVNAKASSIAAFKAAQAYPGMDGAHVLMYMQAHKCSAEAAAELVLKSGLYKPTKN